MEKIKEFLNDLFINILIALATTLGIMVIVIMIRSIVCLFLTNVKLFLIIFLVLFMIVTALEMYDKD